MMEVMYVQVRERDKRRRESHTHTYTHTYTHTHTCSASEEGSAPPARILVMTFGIGKGGALGFVLFD